MVYKVHTGQTFADFESIIRHYQSLKNVFFFKTDSRSLEAAKVWTAKVTFNEKFTCEISFHYVLLHGHKKFRSYRTNWKRRNELI